MPPEIIAAPPAVTIDPALTALITRTIIMIKRKTEGATPVYFRVDSFTDASTNEVTPLKAPGDDGILSNIRRDQTDRDENYKAKTNEVGKWHDLTGGKNIVFDADVRVWKFDAKGDCRYASEEFEASIERDGEVKSGEKTHDAVNFKITSLKQGDVQWYRNPVLTPAATTIATQPPAALSVDEGDTLTLEVTTLGTAPTGYQWKKNGAAIPGATAAIYTKANAAAEDAGGYVCEITATSGALTTTPCVVQVVPA
jgi:hypothetical protein